MVIDPQTVGPVYPAIPSFASVFPVEVDMSHFMSALEARLASIESSISENQASIASHASSISDHENSLSNHEDSISSFENSISNHEDSISSHESSISNHEDKIASNLASITGNVEGISSLRDELQGLASKSKSHIWGKAKNCLVKSGNQYSLVLKFQSLKVYQDFGI